MTAFASFASHSLKVNKVTNTDETISIFCRTAGSGPGVLLLHGHPQTHHIWRHIGPRLSEKFTVVAADLRGYGRSSKPQGSDSHIEYSKREMAKDMVELMLQLGFRKFSIVAHDRGARVAHRLALDYATSVDRLMLLDIAPTLWMYAGTKTSFAMGYWHWFFYPQPYPGPEEVINANPEKYWSMLSSRKSHSNVIWEDEDIREYKKFFFQPETIHAICEDYRASTTIDADHDREDWEDGNLLQIPRLRILWGGKGMIASYGDVVQVWRDHASESVAIDGRALDCGHYIAEEQPEELLIEIEDFLA
ncbi:putative hydrolase or acyltransferase of alpha/beta superfamily [Naematelia encephala]|uniref:Putative hydrolase or acyltransferase of alpha/beta superfamily n=1 Tax=Naematelia encephala TaxID=71784 RepID=A0A1Y2B8E3_9TREE|nr:putative hydrolase or acyltransferase of alpha/beta superfamily [Naematelia encephala]